MRAVGNRKRLRRRRIVIGIGLVAAVVVGLPLVARVCVLLNSRGRVYEDVSEAPKCRVALVLGAGIDRDGQPSQLLADRLEKAIELYEAGRVEKLLMSGDNRFVDYNEPARMTEYVVRRGVPAKDVKEDFAGRRTYDSVYRAKHIFGLDEVIVVSQEFHLSRALFLCDKMGMKAHGVAAGLSSTRGSVRELPASLAAILDVYVRKPMPVMGEKEEI